MIPLHILHMHDDYGNCEELLSDSDKLCLEQGRWNRSSGLVLCLICNKEYFQHPPVIGALWLHRICSGELVKL